MSIDLEPFLPAVPGVVVDRLRNARRVLTVSHENPDADTLGASLAVVRLVESMGGRADPICSDPVPAIYDFLPGIERVRPDPDPAAGYDLAVILDCVAEGVFTVDLEWRIALDRNGLGRINPVPLESPDMAPPPSELAALHFNDWMLPYLRLRSSGPAA